MRLTAAVLLLISTVAFSQSDDINVIVGQVETKSALRVYDLYPLDIRADVLHNLLQNALTNIAGIIPKTQLSPLYQYNESGWSWEISSLSNTGLSYGQLYTITEKALSQAPPSSADVTETLVGRVEVQGQGVADIVIIPQFDIPIPLNGTGQKLPSGPIGPDATLLVETFISNETTTVEEIPQQDSDLAQFLNAFDSHLEQHTAISVAAASNAATSKLRPRQINPATPGAINTILTTMTTLPVPATGLALKLRMYREQAPSGRYVVRRTKVKYMLDAVESAFDQIPLLVAAEKRAGSRSADQIGKISSQTLMTPTDSEVHLQAWIERNIDGRAMPISKLPSGLWVKMLEVLVGFFSQIDVERAALAMEGTIWNVAQDEPVAFGAIRLMCGTEHEL